MYLGAALGEVLLSWLPIRGMVRLDLVTWVPILGMERLDLVKFSMGVCYHGAWDLLGHDVLDTFVMDLSDILVVP
jgi:hypothetical protein